jgi:hypothetical protein
MQQKQLIRCLTPVRLAYQPPFSSTFLSEQTSHQQPVNSIFLSEQASTSHQPNEQVVNLNLFIPAESCSARIMFSLFFSW